MTIVRPNFFIIGAPKSGTTAMSEYLRVHPQIFFSEPKEPQFFASDFKNTGAIKDLDEYLSLFVNAKPHHKIIAEGSTKYLCSRVAIARIEDFSPGAKYLIMLRNPLDMAVSLHEQVLFNGDENERDFEKAWKLQGERREGRSIPRGCDEPLDLQYGYLCKIGAQAERVLSLVGYDRVKIILFDDFAKDVRGVYREILSFLKLDEFEPPSFDRFNRSKRIRFDVIKSITRGTSKIKRALGIELRTGLLRWVDKLNTASSCRPRLTETMLKELHSFFIDDIHLLEELTGRNLERWKKI